MRMVVLGVVALLVQSQSSAPLRITVLEGEGGVNIIQQKTAVRPLVEVRDRNNVPVAGATVTFTIGGGSPAAFAGGVQTLTVTTNAAGQAAAAGLNPLGSGAVQIQVEAAYQGQVATATIAQTNIATAAAAAAIAGGVAAGAGGAGGISGLTIGIIGGAVGGGALVATQVGGGGDTSSVVAPVTTPAVITTPAPTPSESTFTGPISGQIVVTTTSGNSTCVSTRSINGSLTITLRDANTGGVLRTSGTVQEVSVTASALCTPLANSSPFVYSGDVMGGPSNLAFAVETVSTSTGIATVTATESVRFSGSLSGGSISGTLAYTHTTRGTGNGGNAIAGNGSTVMAATLR